MNEVAVIEVTAQELLCGESGKFDLVALCGNHPLCFSNWITVVQQAVV